MNNHVLPIGLEDREKVKEIMVQEWGSDLMVVHHDSFYPHQMPGFKTMDGGEWTGLITYEVRGEECEILTLNSFRPNKGIGDTLIKAVEAVAFENKCITLLLVTTNDNLNALRFYQKRGYYISSIEVGAIIESRKLKPEIPLLGENGIPLRDEIMLKKSLL